MPFYEVGGTWGEHLSRGSTGRRRRGAYCPCALSGTGPSMGHHELLAGFLFNCYQTSYTAYSTLYLHIHKLFLTKSPLCSEIKKRLFVTLCHACPLMSSQGSL